MHSITLHTDIVSSHTDTNMTRTESMIHYILLIRDLNDAYKHCDGDRVFIDAKFVLLQYFSTPHVKYKLWMWRMLAYNLTVLSPAAAFEYKWNISVNLIGGIDNNIPDDNLVELCVKKVKDLLQFQGPNVNFNSAQTACASMTYIDKIKNNIKQNVGLSNRDGQRSDIDKDNDILKIAYEYCNRLTTETMCASYIDKIESEKFYNWCTDQNKFMSAVLFTN